jgi:hypothetical protein
MSAIMFVGVFPDCVFTTEYAWDTTGNECGTKGLKEDEEIKSMSRRRSLDARAHE